MAAANSSAAKAPPRTRQTARRVPLPVACFTETSSRKRRCRSVRQPRAFLRYSITPDVLIRARRVQLILGNISQLLRHRDGIWDSMILETAKNRQFYWVSDGRVTDLCPSK